MALLGIVVGTSAVLVSILRGDAGEGPGLEEPDAREELLEGHEPRLSRTGEQESAAVVRRRRAASGREHTPREAAAEDQAVGPRERSVAAPRTSGAAHAPRAAAPRTRAQPDAGVAAAPDGGARRDAKPPTTRRINVDERSESDEEAELRQVERFVSVGGATLEGRVIEADSGKPVVGTAVHVHHAGMFVEARTDSIGAFRIPGMLPGSRIVLWVGRNGDPFVDERLALAVPVQEAGLKVDAGTIKLLRGDELASRLGAWVGLFVTRRSGQIVVSAVSPWLPADAAELGVGDQVLAIDGRDVAGLGPRAVTYLLRGPVGSSVTLIVRTPEHDKRKLTLTRVLR